MAGPPFPSSFLDSLGRREKAELHLHLEGSIRPSTLVRLSARWPRPLIPDLATFRARRRFDGFEDFLALYRDVCRHLRSPADYALVARDLTRRLRRERITHAEVYVSPVLVERMGLDWRDVRDAIERVFRRFERAGGGRIVVLYDSVRQWGPDAASRVLDLSQAHPWPRAMGFGLGGNELSVPARAFRDVYRRAVRLGLAPLVHAGEWGGADSVAEALRWLRPVRIAHGIRAVSDRALLRQLERKGVVLDLCLASNAATGAVPRGTVHPARSLLAAGIRLSLSTDDPGLFRTTLRGEYGRLARLGATQAELRRVFSTSWAAALGTDFRGHARRSRGTAR